MNLTRRNALKSGVGAVALGGLAGCLDDVAAGETEFDSGYASFFSLWDWSQTIVGDDVSIENPVEVGEMGHGWEPDGDFPREVASTDVFVYLDTPEFAWAQDLAATLQADYEDVAVVDGLEGLESQMIEIDGDGHDHDHDDGHDDDHHDDDHDDHDDHHDDGHDDGHDDDHHDDGHEDDHHDDHHDDGHDDGHDDDHHDDDHDDHDDDHHDDGHDDDHGHDHGDYDPHVWVDPVLAQEVVTNIAAGFAEIDPDHAETYEANAADYNERLADVDAQFEQMIEDAERSVAVLAGHDSFQYLENRYGFELHTPTGISPDSEPSQSDIADTIEVVDEHEIDVILYDEFESPRLAETIVENSTATETAAVSPAEGTTHEWNDNGWDYIDQMEQLNLVSFGQALGAN